MKNDLDLKPTHILNKTVEKIARERADWIDSTIQSHLPKWKVWLLKKYPFLKSFLAVNIEIINEELIADFGTRVWIKLNGKVIGKRNYTA